MIWGEGNREKCGECGGDVSTRDDRLGFLELRGPRNITSSNHDRTFDNGGKRFLTIEEKRPGEEMPGGQEQHLRALSRLQAQEVWLVTGIPEALAIEGWRDGVLGPHRQFPEGNFDTYQAAVYDWFRRTQ